MRMKFLLFPVACFFAMVFLLMLNCSKNINTFNEVEKHFANPPVEFRSVPLTVWNDDVTEEKIERQINMLHSQGIGGVFIHPRLWPYYRIFV